jgi:hypothetical protein
VRAAALRTALAAGLAALGVASAAGCSDDASVVGGACAPGYALCGSRCCPVAPATSGDDGAARPGDSTPSGPFADAGPSPVTSPAVDAGAGDASTTNPDGGPLADAATLDARTCGDLLTSCANVCVDLQSDPTNCGACGRVCPSNLCAAGVCQGANPGDVVYVGHDYAATPAGSAQARVLSNAVFIPRTNPLRVLTYERYAEPAAAGRVRAIVEGTAAALGRTLTLTSTTSDALIPSSLRPASHDVLVVLDQTGAPAGALGALGTAWAPTLDAFTRAGGVVIVLDGNGGSTQEMHRFARSAGLLDVTSHADLAPGSALTVEAPGDATGIGVLTPYGAGSRSATFKVGGSPSSAGTTVVRESVGRRDPVVVHRVVM